MRFARMPPTLNAPVIVLFFSRRRPTEKTMGKLPPIKPTVASDVVVLIPGFLGFSRFGDFYYFSDRISSLLRGVLEARLGDSVPVVPVSTNPAGGLAARQLNLLQALQDLDQEVQGIKRFHLIGHSTGGLDAYFLTRKKSLSGKHWQHKYQSVRERIA